MISIFLCCSTSRILWREMISSNSTIFKLLVFWIQLGTSLFSMIFPFGVKKYEIFNLSKCGFNDSSIGEFKSTLSFLLIQVLEVIFLRDLPKTILCGNK